MRTVLLYVLKWAGEQAAQGMMLIFEMKNKLIPLDGALQMSNFLNPNS